MADDTDIQEDETSLIAKISHPKKKAFLEHFFTFGEIAKTARAVGCTGAVVWWWTQRDKDFSLAFDAVKKRYERELLLKHERNLDNIAFNEAMPAQSRVLASIFVTKALAPNKYRERPAIEAQIIGDITVKLGIPSYSDQPLRVRASETKAIEAKEYKDKANKEKYKQLTEGDGGV